MQNQNLAAFTPITVTAETLARLSKEKNYADLLALYMAYVEITAWQNGNNIKATNSFMMKRLHWGESRIVNAKKVLVEMKLVEPFTRKNAKGLVDGHFILIRHVIQNPLNPGTGFDHALDSEGTNTNDLNKNTNKEKTITPEGVDAPKKKGDEVLKQFYRVVKLYSLVVVNNAHVRKWSENLKSSLGEKVATAYLVRLQERDLREERKTQEFVPQLGRPMDILEKAGKIIDYYTRTKPARDPRSYQ